MGSEDLFHKRKARDSAALQRKKIERSRNKRYLIVCEGTKTEPNYFGELLADLGIRPQVVRIAKNDGSSPDRIVGHALSLYQEDAINGDAYDKVFCVFDRDKHTTFEGAVSRARDLNASGTPIEAITSTPCFEVWLLLHFGYSAQPFHAAGKRSVGDQVVAELRKKPGLEKYGKGMEGVYYLLRDRLNAAMGNAERLRAHLEETGSINPATDVDRLTSALQQLAVEQV